VNAVRPIFPVYSTTPPKSLNETVRDLGTVCHVVEVKAPWVLVHASPMGVARISQELGLEVFPSKRGGEYYAIRVGAKLALLPPVGTQLSLLPNVQPTRQPVRGPGPWVRMDIRGMTYSVRETACKRQCDVRRWEVRKTDGNSLGETYIVTFQNQSGSRTACSCPGGVYHKHCKHMSSLREQFGS
jgi:hypothetical protein